MPSEWALIDALRRELGRGARRGVRVDIGDDAAVMTLPGATALSVDASVEGVHFRRAWAGWDVLAARAFEAAASDLAAMGASASSALLALALPKTLAARDVTAMGRGIARAARRIGCIVVGGNITRASEVSFTTTVLGRADAPMLRSGARVGDDVFVTGALGGAALGLACLEARRSRGAASFVKRLLTPRAKITEGLALRGIAHACIDLSDGLVSDLGHIATASTVRIEIEASRVPRMRGHDALATKLGLDGTELVLSGGEDYELAFTARAGSRIPFRASCIGRVVRGSGVEVIGATPRAQGHDHFR